MQEGHGGRSDFLVRMHPAPGPFLFQRQFQHGRAIAVSEGFPDAAAFAFFPQAFGIAGVVGQYLLGPIARRQMQQEDFRPFIAR